MTVIAVLTLTLVSLIFPRTCRPAGRGSETDKFERVELDRDLRLCRLRRTPVLRRRRESRRIGAASRANISIYTMWPFDPPPPADEPDAWYEDVGDAIYDVATAPENAIYFGLALLAVTLTITIV